MEIKTANRERKNWSEKEISIIKPMKWWKRCDTKVEEITGKKSEKVGNHGVENSRWQWLENQHGKKGNEGR